MDTDKKEPGLNCNCKKKRCRKCRLCAKCSCVCDAVKGKRGRLKTAPDSNAAKKQKTGRPRKIAPLVATAQPPMTLKRAAVAPSPANVPRQLRNVFSRGTASAKTTLSVARPTREACTPVATASKIHSPTPFEPTSPEPKALSEDFLFAVNPEKHSMCLDKDGKAPRTSFKKTAGPVVKSLGDLAAVFEPQVPNMKKQFGNEIVRKSHDNLHESNPKVFASLVAVQAELLDYEARTLYPGNPGKLITETAKKKLGLKPKVGESDAKRKIQELHKGAKKGSTEKRSIAAAMKHLHGARSLPEGHTQRSNAAADLEEMLSKGSLTRQQFKRRKAPFDIVSDAVQFTLSPENIKPLSWGHKKIELDACETAELPRMTRKDQRAVLHKRYQNAFKHKRSLGRSSFLHLLTKITLEDEQIVTCVDCVLGNLVNDPVERLQKIINTFLAGERQKTMTTCLAHVRNFLKVQLDKHLTKEDGCETHDLTHALSKKDLTQQTCPVDAPHPCSVCRSESPTPSVSKCAACKFCFWHCDKLTSPLQGAKTSSQNNSSNPSGTCSSLRHDEACEVVADAKEKFCLHCKHRARVVCQRQSHSNRIEQLRQQCVNSRGEETHNRCLIVVDWKQKFDPLSGRETMPENFGKRGIGWHGTAVVFFEWDEESQDAIQKVFCTDQMLEDSNKQDSLAVLSMAEAATAAIRINLPFIKEADFASDNAGCYQSKVLTLALAVLNAKNHGEFFIRTLFHTETQDGKGIVDSHFALAMAHLRKHVKSARDNQIRRICTPRGLASALSWNNGIANSIVQLVSTNRSEMESLAKLLDKAAKGAKKCFSRANEIQFVLPSEDDRDRLKDTDWSDFDAWRHSMQDMSMSFRAQAHSGCSKCAGFVMPQASTGKCDPDEVSCEECRRLALNHNAGDDEDDDISVSSAQETFDNSWEREGECEPESDFEHASDGKDNDDDELEGFEEEIVSDDDTNQHDSSLFDPNNALEHRSCSEPTDTVYQAQQMMSGVLVHRTSCLHRQDTPRQSRTGRKRTSKKAPSDRPSNMHARRDVVAVGARLAKETLSSEHSFVQDANEIDNKMCDVAKDHVLEPAKFSTGYARRQAGDDLFGARCIGPYEAEIREMHEAGNADPSKKCQPARMVEKLESLHPGSLKIPSECEVRCRVSSWVQKKRKKDSDHEEPPLDGAEEDSPEDDGSVPKAVALFIEFERLPGRLDDKPEVICQEIVHKFPQFNPSTKKDLIKKKIGYLKKKLKDRAWRDVL